MGWLALGHPGGDIGRKAAGRNRTPGLERGVAIPVRFERIAKVPPRAVAAAIVDSVRDRPREVCVPRWIGGYQPLTALVPGAVEERVRRLIRDDRAITQLSPAGRAGYSERLARQGAPES